MKNNVVKELKDLSNEQLIGKLEEFRQELFKLRINAATAHIKSFPSDQRLLKKNIARALTFLHKKNEEMKS
ncbi:MAG: 50S ribosomal protein L29 [Candidatus Babeliaceae bacterium]